MQDQPSPPVLWRDEGHVVIWTIDRPAKLNALDGVTIAALHDACALLESKVAAAAADPSLPMPAALVVTGAGGRAFVAGADIAELRQRRAPDALAAINSRLFDRVARLPLPTIAAVRGFALGGGCELAIACDLRVAGRSAKFGQPEVSLGIMAAAGGTYRLPALIGLGRARELLYTGRIVDADEALAIGLCEQVVADDDVVDAAIALAQRIARNDALAVRMTKVSLARSGVGGPNAIASESTIQALLFESPTKFARMDAFLAKRRAKSEPA